VISYENNSLDKTTMCEQNRFSREVASTESTNSPTFATLLGGF
jgi:hypothetical protein